MVVKKLSVIIVNFPRHKLVFRLRNTGGVWDGDKHNLNKEHGRSLSEKTKTRLMRGDDVTRVITVRHPFSRLLSGWNDKFRK